MATNIVVPGLSSFTPGLIADPTLSYPAGPNMPASGPGGVATFTTVTVAGVQKTVSAALEIQSTTGAFLLPRMTAAQRLALVPTNGMDVYETDTQSRWWYNNGSWSQVSTGGGGGGDISGPGASTLNALVSWNNTLGTSVKDNKALITTSVLDTNASDLALIATIQASKGADTTGATPNYSFTGDVGTGMWSSGANVLDFSTNAVSQLRIAGVASAANRILISGAVTGTLPANAALIKSSGSDAQVDIGLVAHGNTSGISLLPNDGAAVSPLRFWNAAGTFYTSLQTGVNAANLALTLPVVDATAANQPLVSDGAGNLSFYGTALSGFVVGPASATDNAITRYDGTTGKLVQNSAATIVDTTGTITLSANGQFIADVGAVGSPAFTFLGDTNTGIYRVAAEQIGFAANGELNFAIRDGAGTVVNTIFVQGAATGSKATIGINLSAGDANQDLALLGRGTGGVAIMPTALPNSGLLKLYTQSGANFTGLQCASPQTVDLTYVLPATGPSAANQVLTNGSDTTNPYQLQWTTNFASNVIYASGTILNADALTLDSVPINLIAAPGAGSTILIVRLAFEFVGTTAFTGTSDIVVEYGNTVSGGGPLASGNVSHTVYTGLSASTIVFSNPTVAQIVISTASDAGVYLSATAPLVGGGDINWYAFYSVITTT